MKAKELTNKKMNNKVYTERRKVMDCIYKAKNLLRSNGIEMPRITIRITEKHDHILGMAGMNRNVIWIPDSTLNNASKLYTTVLHELCHAIYGIDHNENCKLMHPVIQKLTVKQAEKIFLNYAKINAN